MRPEWDEYFLDVTATVAKRSTCLRVPDGIGALLVRDRRILSTGYAGSIESDDHCFNVGCLIDEKTGGCVRTVHAEMNTIIQAAQHGVNISGATLYSTMSPCWDCFKAVANSKIKKIIYRVEYRTVERQKEFASRLGIEFIHKGTEIYTGGVKK